MTAVIVAYENEPEQLRACIDSLLTQTVRPSEIMVVDNGGTGQLARSMHRYAAEVKGIESGGNLGYGPAVNLAAHQAGGDYLLCLNPDACARPDCLSELLVVAESDPSIAIVGAQILLGDGWRRNAGENPLHPTGISPSGGYGEAREYGDPRDVIVISGACFLLRRSALGALDGFIDEFFLYYEDADICWRAIIAGMRVVYCPAAIVVHDYEFGGRPNKWFFLERNRLFSVLANYAPTTLLLLAPLLLASELGLLAVAASGGWLPQKIRAYGSLFALRRRLLERRRAVQASRRRSDREVLAHMNDRLLSALIARRWASVANCFCVPYMRAVRALIRD